MVQQNPPAVLRGQIPGWDYTKLTIPQAPRIREVYWICTPEGSVPPEFEGYHPGVIIRASGGNSAKVATVSFVPLTTATPEVNSEGKIPSHTYALSRNPNPQDPGRQCWAICNQIITVRLHRLEQYKGATNKPMVPRVSDRDFAGIMSSIWRGFHAFKTFSEELIEQAKTKYQQDLDDAHAARLAELERTFENRADKRAWEILDEKTTA